MRTLVFALISLLIAAGTCVAAEIECSLTPDDPSSASNNTAALNAALSSMRPGDRLTIPNRTFWLAGGVYASGLVNATIQLDGTLRFLAGRKGWPTEPCRSKTCVKKAILIANVVGLTLTSAGDGIVDGNGASWWGYIQCE